LQLDCPVEECQGVVTAALRGKVLAVNSPSTTALSGAISTN